jgi:hypothetical protein
MYNYEDTIKYNTIYCIISLSVIIVMDLELKHAIFPVGNVQ